MLARYVVRRVLQLIPVLILVILAVFLLVRVIPGDPVLVMLGIDPDERTRISAEQYRVLQHQIGLDQPIYVQYLNWADKIVHGDFGLSLATRRPIVDIIFDRYPATLYLEDDIDDRPARRYHLRALPGDALPRRDGAFHR